MTQKTAKQFSPELRERAVRMVQDREREGGTQWDQLAPSLPRSAVRVNAQTLGAAGRAGCRSAARTDDG